jgi:CBS domain-containing protein
MARKQTQDDAELLLQEVMTRELETVTPETTLREVLELLDARHIGGLPVVSNGGVVGVISASDVLSFMASTTMLNGEFTDPTEWFGWGAGPECVAAEEPLSSYFLENWEDVGAGKREPIHAASCPEWDWLAEHTVAETMSGMICALPPDASVCEAADYMLRAGIHRVLVMEGSDLRGLVTTSDIVRAVAEHRL